MAQILTAKNREHPFSYSHITFNSTYFNIMRSIMSTKSKSQITKIENQESGIVDHKAETDNQNQKTVPTSPRSAIHMKSTNHVQIPMNNHVKPLKLSSLVHINSSQVLLQKNPRLTSGTHSLYKHKRSFTHSLESYELYAKKIYILLYFSRLKIPFNFRRVGSFQ